MPTLEWIGKNKVVNHHQEVPFRVLERQYSFDEQGRHTENNGSENMIIHGDNLEALKALLPQYEGKVKCIYLSKPPIGYRCEGSAAIPSDRLWKKQMWMGEMHRHRLIATPRITNRIDRQIQLTPFLRFVKASKEHFACCFACSNWDAPA